MISLDTECTGLDLRHGSMPFLVTVCNEDMEQTYWEWDVDPITRQPDIPEEDIIEVAAALNPHRTEGEHVLQNPKFDVKALSTVIPEFGKYWLWENTRDTLLAGHLLASNEPHDLTSMAMKYLGIDLEPYETRIKNATKQARNIARSKLPDWRIAKKGLPEMPSAKDTVWKNDMWLPRAIVLLSPEHLPDSIDWDSIGIQDHPWATLLSEYANSDSAATLLLFRKQAELLKERGLWEIYLERLKILPIVYQMEDVGVTINRERLEELRQDYIAEAETAGNKCVNIAAGFDYELTLPKSGNNNSLLEFCFDKLDLPVSKKSPLTGKPSLDASVIDTYKATLPERSKQLAFVCNLSNKRKRDTALSYLEGYEKFWLLVDGDEFVLHPSLNPTGTNTLRWSSSSPNEQNISKREGFNLRYAFGPAPGREWWSLDANNIELRLPAYEAGETEMIELFERPDDPPYYGSYHLLVFDTLHPKRFAEYGVEVKDVFASTWYQWTKNGNFAAQYQAGDATADRAYHVPGALAKMKKKFPKIAELNRQMIAQADRYGYVETIPDRTVDPDKGYPLLCTRSRWGKTKPTIPLNYHIQGTACWWMMKAMIRCQEFLNGTRDGCMVMQVHDELVFDLPNEGKYRHPRDWISKQEFNKPLVDKLRSLMEQGGDDIGIPTPVSISYHPNNWSESE